MKILVVTNPAARRTRPQMARWVADRLSDHAKVQVVATTHRNHACEIAQQAADDGVDAVVALGGDGTLNEVLQGVAGTATGLAVLPGGSTNVYARILGLPHSLVGATAVLVGALEQGRSRQVPAGRANDRWFAWCAGMGLDADAVQHVEWHPRMKQRLGSLAFLIQGWKARARAEGTTIDVVAAEALNETRQRSAPNSARVAGAAVICNADPFTFLGPLAARMCPEATLERGLDLTAMTDVSLGSMFSVMGKALTGRDVRDLAAVRAWHDRERYLLTSPTPLAVQTDGDAIGTTRELDVSWHPDAIRLIA